MCTMGEQELHYFAVIDMANCTCNCQLYPRLPFNQILTNIYVRLVALEGCRICSSCVSIVSKDSIDRVCASRL
jgi:hypothetical protein